MNINSSGHDIKLTAELWGNQSIEGQWYHSVYKDKESWEEWGGDERGHPPHLHRRRHRAQPSPEVELPKGHGGARPSCIYTSPNQTPWSPQALFI